MALTIGAVLILIAVALAKDVADNFVTDKIARELKAILRNIALGLAAVVGGALAAAAGQPAGLFFVLVGLVSTPYYYDRLKNYPGEKIDEIVGKVKLAIWCLVIGSAFLAFADLPHLGSRRSTVAARSKIDVAKTHHVARQGYARESADGNPIGIVDVGDTFTVISESEGWLLVEGTASCFRNPGNQADAYPCNRKYWIGSSLLQ